MATFSGKSCQSSFAPAKATDDVLERTGNEKILLEQTKFLSAVRLVVRVKNFGNDFAVILVPNGFLVAAAVERFEIEFLRRSRLPKPQKIHSVGSIAGNRNVVGDPDKLLPAHPARDVVATVVEDIFYVSVDLEFPWLLRSDDFPRCSVLHPCVGQFDLIAIAEFLPEEPVLVMNAVADRWKIERRQRVQEARGESAETAIAQPMSYSSWRSSS